MFLFTFSFFNISVRVIKEPSGRHHEKNTAQYTSRAERERTYIQEQEDKHSTRRDRTRSRSRSAKREKKHERTRSRSGGRRVANVSAQVQPTARDVSVNCPSPIIPSPPTRRKKQVHTVFI